jgi:hypothetical protein
MIIPNIWKQVFQTTNQMNFSLKKKVILPLSVDLSAKKKVFDHQTYMETWCCQDATENKWSYEHLQQ